MLKTRLTELLGIQYPVISAPMALMSGGTLAASVSAAGGLGTFGGLSPSVAASPPDYIRRQIRMIRDHTDRPFGVGFITHFLHLSPQNLDTALEEQAPVLMFSFGNPAPWLRLVKQTSAIAICQVQTMEAAVAAVDAGADVLAAQGNESGGHTGVMHLLPFLVRLVEKFPNIPVVAAGGIAAGRSLAAALAAGAEGAWVGTAFLATPENNEISEKYKEILVQHGGDDTVWTEVMDIIRTAIRGTPAWPEGIRVRVHNTEFVRSWHGREDELRAHLDEVIPAFKAAAQREDRNMVPALFGQSADFVHAVRPAADVLRELCETAEQRLLTRVRDIVQ